MKYPKLVPNWVCSIPISLEIEGEGITEDGAPAGITKVEALGNWQDGGETIYTTDQKQIKISGKAYFTEDIVPSITNISGGYGYIFGEKREIYKGFKHRNPDGSVNHVEVQFR